MDNDTLLRLETYNPWLADRDSWPGAAAKYLPARPVARSEDLALEPDLVELIVGPRQAGKSTLIWLRASTLPSPPLLVNLDDRLLRRICGSGAQFLAETRELRYRPSALLFEEVQHLEEAGLFLKSLADLKPGVPIIATGSSAFHLHARTRESLAGRARRTLLLPFSQQELTEHALISEPAYRRTSVAQSCLKYLLRYGGYPGVWLAGEEREKERLLLNLVEAFLMRDASDLYRIRRPDAFRRVVRLAAGQVGSLVNQAEYAAICGISVGTVSQYLDILEHSHVIRLLRPFLGGRRAELSSNPKLYFLDNGLRNHLQGGFEPFERRGDRGPLLENHVFTELAKSLDSTTELSFWRTRNGAEVDFVLSGRNALLAVEVKASASPRTTLPRAAKSFIQAYRPTAFVVVSLGPEGDSDLVGVPVLFRRPEALAATVTELLAGAR